MINKFSDNVLKEAKLVSVNESSFDSRKEVEGFTIDSEVTKDMDDGFALEKEGENYLLQISITDVSKFIQRNSLLFQEAFDRVESRYLKNFTVPMLPRILSENKLSFMEGKKRDALTLEIEISPDCEILKTNIKETFFTNKRQLSYTKFDKIVDDETTDPDYTTLTNCSNLAQIHLNNRRQKGALAIYDLKRLIFTNEEGLLLPLNPEKAHKGNIVIQEFMILANKVMARFAIENDIPILFRNHTARQNVPGREEVISQFNLAFLNENLIESLSERAVFWFNKASYDSTLKGHYGLNEAAYTHMTSPIRRFADLVNHYQIKSFLHNEKFIFNHQELEILSKSINEKILHDQESRSEFHKNKTKSEAIFNLKIKDPVSFVNMEPNKLKQVIKLVCEEKRWTDELILGISKLAEMNKLDVSHLFTILFESKSTNDIPSELYELILNYLSDNIGFSNQLLNLAVQISERLTAVSVEMLEANGMFLARVIGVIEDKEYSTALFSFGKNKKEAHHRASHDFLSNLLTNRLVSSDKSKKPKMELLESNNVKLEKIDENFIGRLHEICTIQENWSIPTYTFSSDYSLTETIFECKCSLNIKNELLEISSKAANKKMAKHLASKKMIEKIEKEYDILSSVNNEFEIELSKNCISKVFEICQKNKWANPKIEFERFGEDHNPTFECKLKINDLNTVHEFIGISTNKKEAKEEASCNCLRFLGSLDPI